MIAAATGHGLGEYLAIGAGALTLIGLILGTVARGYARHNDLRRELEKQIQKNMDRAEEAQKLLEARCGDRASALHVRLNETRETYVLKEDLNRQLNGLGRELTALQLEVRQGFGKVDEEIKLMPERIMQLLGRPGG